MEDWISIMYIIILYSNRCSAITVPSAGRMILFLKNSKKGRLKRQRQMRSLWRDYHSTFSMGESTFALRQSMKAMIQMSRERKQGIQDSSPKKRMARIATKGRTMNRNSPKSCQNLSLVLSRLFGTGALDTSCTFLPLGKVSNISGWKSFLLKSNFFNFQRYSLILSYLLLLTYCSFSSGCVSLGYFSRQMLVGTVGLRQERQNSLSLSTNLTISVAIRNSLKMGDSSPYFEKMRNSARNWRVLKFWRERPFLRAQLR